MNSFTIASNEFLNKNIKGFYHTDYVGYRKPGNPDFINVLKNTFNSSSASMLNQSVAELKNVLVEDWDSLVWDISYPLAIIVVPRAKVNYSPKQLLFKTTISAVIREMNIKWWGSENSENSFIDGTNYILRHTNTRTTHLPLTTPNYNNDGNSPYPGITKATCKISNEVRGKNIILIDDIYTKSINIDEDAIQALLDNGAKSVIFYAVAKTQARH